MTTAFQPSAFQNNAFQIAGVIPPAPEPYHQPGGGYYRPIIYLDENGKPTTLEEYRRRRNATDAVSEVVAPLVLSPEVLQALFSAPPGTDPAKLLAMIDEAERKLVWSDFDRQHAAQQAADDEEALAIALVALF